MMNLQLLVFPQYCADKTAWLVVKVNYEDKE
jgi:hypothetical protein